MTDRNETNGHPEKPEPKPVTLPELRRQAICKKRYGRATLTIRRWGRLVGEHELAGKLAAFRDGRADADEVAWAFVQARVEAHSPTFSWEGGRSLPPPQPSRRLLTRSGV